MSAHISASGSLAETRSISPTAALVAVVATATLVRLLVAADIPLTEDEAYYRLWSMRPAFGYFDHPPMIAWWIWLGRHLAGDNPLGVRLMPTLATALTSFLTFDAARAAGLGDRIAARAGIWLNATALIGVGGELAVPDGPATLFWIGAVCCALRAVRGPGAWWLAAGAAAGLACLSKYSALFLAPGILLWLALTPEGRRQLRTPWPWLAAVVAAAIFAPNVAWNASHGWMTFDKQFGRVEVSGLQPAYLVKLLTDQVLLLTPLITLFGVLAVRQRAAWPLLAIGAPFAAYLVFHSLHAEVQGQWPAPLYPGLALAAAAAAERAAGWLAAARTAAGPLGLASSGLALAFLVAPADAWLSFRDPTAAYRGWDNFPAAVERVRAATGAGWVGASTYGVAAQFAASRRLGAPAAQLYQRDRYTFEAPAERADFSRPGLVVVPPKGASLKALRWCFADVRVLPSLVRGAGASRVAYATYLVAHPLVDIERDGCPLRGPDLAAGWPAP